MRTGVLLLVLGGCVQGEPDPPEPIPDRVHVADGHLRDELGRALILRGVNVSNSAKSPATGFVGTTTEEQLAALPGMGFNAVRLLTFWEAVEPEPGVYDQAYLAGLDERIRWAVDAGLYVVLDMHQDVFGRGFGFDGAPRWACDEALYDSFVATQPWSLNYFADEVEECFDRFWADEALQAHFAGAWQEVAARTADEPGVIGYDLYNEPSWGSSTDVEAFGAEVLQPFYEDVIAAIREVAPDKVVFVEPTNIAQLATVGTGFTPFADPEVVYAPHYYLPAIHEGRPYTGDPTPMLTTLSDFDRTAEAMGAPWWLGEYGGPTQAEGFGDYLRDVEEILAGYLVGSAVWSLDCSTGSFSILDDSCAPKPEPAAILAHPHPRRIGGDPVEGSYRFESAELDLRVRRRPGVDPVTVLWLGHDTYPGGFTVHTTDPVSDWSWEAATGMLTVQADPLRPEQHISVAPLR